MTSGRKRIILDNFNEKINIIDKISNMIRKYGFQNVFSALLIFILFVVTSIIFLNQKAIVQRIVTEQKEVIQQNSAKNLRFRIEEVNPRVESILYKLLVETDCDRSYVLEMHNGIDNPSGLPFAYADMTYEITLDDSVESIMEESKGLNLATYPMATYLMTYKSFSGTVEDLRKIDKKLAKRLDNSNAKYVILYAIRGGDMCLGWVGVSYLNGVMKNKKLTEAALLDASQRLSILLDINKNIDGLSKMNVLK